MVSFTSRRVHSGLRRPIRICNRAAVPQLCGLSKTAARVSSPKSGMNPAARDNAHAPQQTHRTRPRFGCFDACLSPTIPLTIERVSSLVMGGPRPRVCEPADSLDDPQDVHRRAARLPGRLCVRHVRPLLADRDADFSVGGDLLGRQPEPRPPFERLHLSRHGGLLPARDGEPGLFQHAGTLRGNRQRHSRRDDQKVSDAADRHARLPVLVPGGPQAGVLRRGDDPLRDRLLALPQLLQRLARRADGGGVAGVPRSGVPCRLSDGSADRSDRVLVPRGEFARFSST